MRLALLSDQIPPEGAGGAEAVVWRLARGLADEGHDVHVIAATRGASFEEIRDGVPTYHIHSVYPERFRAWLSLWNPRTVGQLRALLLRLQPQVVNAHNIHFYLSYHALKVARDAGAATVFSAHDVMPFAYSKLRHFTRGGPRQINLPDAYRLPRFYNLKKNRFRYNPWRNRIIRRYLSLYAERRTVPSRALAQAFMANGLPPADVVHNGIDLREWSEADRALVLELRRRFDLAGKQVVLIAGRLTPDKGTVPLLKAMDRLKERLPGVTVLALTARDIDEQIPAAYSHLRSLIRAGGWLGGAELRAAYDLADVVVVPSVIFDTFPTVNLEAMAAGKPVVATCFGGSPEIIIDGETGFIVNPFDTATLAERLGRLLADRDLSREMGRRGRARIRERFALDKQVEQMLAIYATARGDRGSS
ncbi:MAG: glycosyltransferase family 4 protein [Chloroflexi bacterium]|nr:glycosyltransferase family 4 protein [Chloroflexota bacterium]